jgi:hypothetical protein
VLGVLNVSLWGGWLGWRRRPQFLRRMALMIPVFLVPHLMEGTVREVRYYLPILAILVPLAIFYLLEITREEPVSVTEPEREAASMRITVAAPTMAARTSK